MTGAVAVQVKKWMRRFMQAEGPSTVYTPPPGKSPDDPLRGSPSGAAATADEPPTRRRPRQQQIVVQSAESPGAVAREDSGSSASADLDGPTSLEPWDAGGVWERDGGAAAGPDAAAPARAGPGRRTQEMREQRVPRLKGPSEDTAGTDGPPSGVNGSRSEPGVGGNEGGSQGEAELSALQKPARGKALSVSGRIYRPRWRPDSTQSSRGSQPEPDAAQSTNASGGTAAGEAKESVWDAEWDNGGGGDGAGTEWRSEVEVSAAFSAGGVAEGNGSSRHSSGRRSSGSGSGVGGNGGGNGGAAAAGGSSSVADGKDSAHVVW